MSENRENAAAATSVVGNTGMQKLIPIFNKIQDVCTQLGTHLAIDMPQIAVVGSQSGGKSSVLESFVGKYFLPRGTGIVTRQPLILQLVNGPEEYGEFQHCKGKKFTDFDEIRAEIAAETDKTSGRNRGVTNNPINLCIHSPNVLNLSLIDLPGMTQNPVGDQPENIGEIIREMIFDYISKENCLILAVSPANNDLVNSDAVNLARQVDKEGLRTIGVITKLDLMDKGTDALEILENKLLPLRRGYIGVVNRSQDAIDKKQDIARTLKYERTFFENSCYRHIMDRMGTPYLQQVLNRQLTEHIRKTLPALQDKLRKQMVTLEKEVFDFKQLHPDEPEIINEVMSNVLKKLGIDFQTEIGTLGAKTVNAECLNSGAKIRRIFHQRLPREIYSTQNDRTHVQQDIHTTINNLYGTKCTLYPPYMAFENVVRKQILQLKNPIMTCVDLVVDELSNAVRNCTQHISSYPSFRDKLENNIMTFIHKNRLQFQNNVLSLIKMEAAYMNTEHEDFINDCKNPQRRTKSSEQLNGPTASVVNSYVDDVVIRRGAFKIKNFKNEEKGSTLSGGISDPFYFVLTSKTLRCSTKSAENKNERLLMIPLDGLKLRNSEDTAKKLVIALFNPSGQNVHPDYKELELLCKNIDEYNLWVESFSNVLNNNENPKPMEINNLSPSMKDVFDIHDKIDSYMRIVKKTVRDMFPKAVTLYIIGELEKYITTDLLLVIMNIPSDKHAELFAADPQNAEKYESTKKMHETCEKALNEITQI